VKEISDEMKGIYSRAPPAARFWSIATFRTGLHPDEFNAETSLRRNSQSSSACGSTVDNDQRYSLRS
jgi:hypothetical protein